MQAIITHTAKPTNAIAAALTFAVAVCAGGTVLAAAVAGYIQYLG